MNKTNVAEIKKFLKEIKDWYKERQKDKLVPLVDMKPINSFEEELLLVKNNKVGVREIWEQYFKYFDQFFIGIDEIDKSQGPNSPIVENLSSLSKLLYLLDVSFGITSDILLVNYSENETREKKDFYLNFLWAVKIVERKRNAIFNYINPFDTLDLEKKNVDQIQ